MCCCYFCCCCGCLFSLLFLAVLFFCNANFSLSSSELSPRFTIRFSTSKREKQNFPSWVPFLINTNKKKNINTQNLTRCSLCCLVLVSYCNLGVVVVVFLHFFSFRLYFIEFFFTSWSNAYILNKYKYKSIYIKQCAKNVKWQWWLLSKVCLHEKAKVVEKSVSKNKMFVHWLNFFLRRRITKWKEIRIMFHATIV